MSHPLEHYHDTPAPVRSSLPYSDVVNGHDAHSADEREHLITEVKDAIDEDEEYLGVLPVSLSKMSSTTVKRRHHIFAFAIMLFAGLIAVFIISRSTPPKGFSKGFSACAQDKDIECGFVNVPRNYFNASAGRSDIAVARYRATDLKRRIGTLFINPGGPGTSGVHFAYKIAKPLSRLLRGRYDIVGFDPRGVGQTKQAVACFATIEEHQIFRMASPLSRSFDIPPDPASVEGRAVLSSQIREWLSLTEAQFELCQRAHGSEDLTYMSTATVVRDIDYMTTLFDGEDSLINFFGISYGTILGSYLFNMFPHRIGRAAIDGVVHPDMWANAPSHTWLNQWMNTTEFAFDYLLTECGSVGPEKCPLSRSKGESAADISTKIDRFLDDTYRRPISVISPAAPRTSIITSGMVRALLYTSVVAPKNFPRTANAIANAMEGNYTELAILTVHNVDKSGEALPGDVARSIIACLDSPTYEVDKRDKWPSVEEYTDIAIERLKSVSPRFAMSPLLFDPDGGCQYLSSVASNLPERFTGPFNQTLSNPVLVVNGDMDPLTPLVSARLVRDQLGDSARLVIQQKTPAHTSFFFGPSLCTARTYRRYFVSGLLPDSNETFCGSDETIFDADVSELPSNSLDAELRAIVQELSQVLYNWIPAGLPA